MRRPLQRFFAWYERHYALNVGIVAGLFLLQLGHLYWLTAHVVALRLTGQSWFDPSGPLRVLIYLVDYTEIPALLGTSLIYLNALHRGWSWRPVLFLILLNSQWLHLFWITDEYVVAEFAGTDGGGGALPPWLAWVAIGIDYLELPVIVDTLRTFFGSLRGRRTGTAPIPEAS